MKKLTPSALVACAWAILAIAAPRAQAQVTLRIGVEPVCPYGYFDYRPYECAPYGYYGPEWFNGGAFIGAGPWFHGRDHFRGHIDEHFDPHHGYRGELPHRGERGDWQHHHGTVENFHGHASRDEHRHGNEGHGDHGH